MKKYFRFFIVLCASILFAACNKPANKPSQTQASNKVEVVASFSILADLAQEIGGERVNVSVLVGANQDAHVFQPTPQDIKKVANAQVLISNGLGFEGWLDRLNQSAQFKGTAIVASTGVQPLKLEGEAHDSHEAHAEHGHDSQDPHAWQNIQNVRDFYITNILAGLIKADAPGTDYYQQRAAAYHEKLNQLDTSIEQRFAKIPQARRKVVTSHDAFGYFGHRYAVQFIAPQGISTESEASAKTVANLIRQIKQEQVKAIFIESISNRQLLEQISKETGAKIGGELYSDALSEPNAAGSSYVNMMKHNADTILESFR